MQDKIKIFALGGLDESGKNMLIMECNSDIFIIDAGIKYPDKHTPGVDAIIPDFKYLEENKNRVKAYIISHGHDDQMGALPYFYLKVPAPVYCSKVSKILIEKKTKDYGLDINYDFHIVKGKDIVKINNHEFTFIEMTHSLPESLALALYTEYGYIVYTSDFIVDFGANQNHQMDLAYLAKIAEKEVFLLISESCDATKIGHTSPRHRLTPLLHNLLTNQKGRIFISIYSQNAFNQKELIDLAIKLNKKILYLNQEDFELIKTIEYNSLLPNDKFIRFEDFSRVSEQDLIVVVTGAGEDLFNTLNQLATGIYDGRNIEFNQNDTFVIASPSVSGTEVISIQAIDNIYKTGAEVINLTRKDIASMHAQEEDLKMMLSLLKPKYYLPVKGDYISLLANAKIALNSLLGLKHTNIFVIDNGMPLNIENGNIKTEFNNLIPSGDLMVDGNSIGSLENEIIEERQKMACDGIIVIASTVSKKEKKVIAGPDVQMRGFIFLKDSENIVEQILSIFNAQVDVYLTDYYGDKNVIIERIKDRIYKYVRKETGKNPLIIPHIIEID